MLTSELPYASGDWLDSVIWDDRHMPSSAFNNPLIFDLNDKEMLFEENVKKLEEEEQVNEEVPEEEQLGKVKKRRGRRPKRKIDEIANMVEDEVEEDLDPFNYSLDRIYANASRALARIRPKNMGKPVVQHSIPALKLSSFKTNFTPEELRLFHRPRTKLPVSKQIKVIPTSMEGSRTNPRFKSGTIRRKRELSGRPIYIASPLPLLCARSLTGCLNCLNRQGWTNHSGGILGRASPTSKQRRNGYQDSQLLPVPTGSSLAVTELVI